MIVCLQQLKNILFESNNNYLPEPIIISLNQYICWIMQTIYLLVVGIFISFAKKLFDFKNLLVEGKIYCFWPIIIGCVNPFVSCGKQFVAFLPKTNFYWLREIIIR